MFEHKVVLLDHTHLVSLVDAINKLLRWRVPCEADGSRVDCYNFHFLRRCCGN